MSEANGVAVSPAKRLAASLAAKGEAKTPVDARPRLRDLREEAGLSQGQACEHLGIHQTEWSRVERGVAYPSFRNALAIARFFGVRVEDIWQLPAEESAAGS